MTPKINLSFIIVALSITCMAFTCGGKKGICDDVMCTQEFRSFTITTLDAQLNAFIPDKVVITNMVNNTPITTFTGNTTNTFTVFSDANIALISDMKIAQSIKVDAIVNNVVKASTVLQFNKDCCHVSKISGIDSLIIN